MSATMVIKALVKAAGKARRLLSRDRDSLWESHVNPGTGRIDDRGEQRFIDQYDDALRSIDEAVAKATGKGAA